MSEASDPNKEQHPLVSCIMPTADRRPFVRRAIEYFLRQDYNNKELVIVDDGADPVSDLVSEDCGIRYFRLDTRANVGAKRNIACEHARGVIIVHWDDDDWHAPHQLSYQVGTLLREAKQICGIQVLLFYDVAQQQAWRYTYRPGPKQWLSGSSLCYTRAFWSTHRFADIDVGEDGRFVWAARPEEITVLSDHTFHVGIIHERNVSPKQTKGIFWSPYPAEEIRKLLGDDWDYYSRRNGTPERGPQIQNITTAFTVDAPLRNVFACLIHESQECIVDLVRNLRYLDPSSTILLYNGGNDRDLLRRGFPFERYGAVVVPGPRKLSWGKLHDFAIDCMKFALDHLAFDTMTIVDSDQLGVRPDYSRFLARHLENQPHVGMLGNSPERQLPTTRIPPAVAALKERELWRPYLRRFDHGEEKFPHWSFWPATVFTVEGARALVTLFRDDTQLQEILRRSQLWATEEVILPTLLALLGHRISLNPCSYEYVKYRQPYTRRQIDDSLSRSNVYWIHPVARRYDDPIRGRIRSHFDHYARRATENRFPTANHQSERREPSLVSPILTAMRAIEGWLEEDEAQLMIAVTEKAIRESSAVPTIVELGSYCGRSTVVLWNVVKAVRPEAKVYAIDPHDGRVGALDEGIRQMPSSRAKFVHNISTADLSHYVEMIQKRPSEVAWEKAISLLLIDGLHDYVNVARDFFHYEPYVVPGGLILFHDYANYYPGVKAFVDELLTFKTYKVIHHVRSLVVVRKEGHDSTIRGAGKSLLYAGVEGANGDIFGRSLKNEIIVGSTES